MILDNGILKLELTNKGGEMASLIYKDMDVLYKGDGPYWGGKNPTLFPMISSPNSKKYTLDGITYPCRNHGLIRYMNLETVKDDGNSVKMRLVSNEETLKEYPFDFEYSIEYKLDGNKVLVNYEIINRSNKVMPFTFGLHPGFIVRDFNDMEIIFKDDPKATLLDERDFSTTIVDLDNYNGERFLKDLDEYKTVIFSHLKTKVITLKTKEYSIDLDVSNYRYFALWTADPNSNYICLEPWLSINDIKNTTNPFDSKYELEYLKPNEVFKIDYSFSVN